MDNRSVILKSATQLFLQSVYSEVSVREISVLSGVSNTYVHKLFGSKESLYIEVLRQEDYQLCESIVGFDGGLEDLLMRLFTIPVPFLSLLCSSAYASETRRIVSKYLKSNPDNSLVKIEGMFEEVTPHNHLWPLYLTTVLTSSQGLDLTYLGFSGKSDEECLLLRGSIRNFFSGFLSAHSKLAQTIGEGHA